MTKEGEGLIHIICLENTGMFIMLLYLNWMIFPLELENIADTLRFL